MRTSRRQVLGAGAGFAGSAILLAACGTAAAPMEEAAEAEAPQAEAEEKPAAPMEATEVVYWSLTSSWGSFNEEVGADLVAEFNETFDAYNVTTVPKSGRDNRDTLPAAVAGGAAPDMAFQDRYIPKTMAVNGIVRDITDMVKASSIINTADMWERILNDVTYRGHHFGLPWSADVRTLFYNDDALVEVGLDPESPPTSWDEFHEAINLTFKKDGANIERLGFVPLWGSGGALAGWMIPYWQQGGSLTSADDSTSTMDNELMVNAFEHTLRMYEAQDGYAAIQEFRGEIRPQQIFVDGKLAMYFEIYDIPNFPDYREGFAALNYGLAVEPIPPGGTPATYGGGGSKVLPNASTNPEGAFAFLEWLYDAPQELRFNDEKGRLPVQQAIANSPEWTKDDPLRLQAAVEMAGAHWVVTAPGGIQILGLHVALPRTIYQGEKTIQEAIAETNEQTQIVLDETLANSVLDF